MKLHFSGTYYVSAGLDFRFPQDIEVTDEKGKQLLADFPEEFTEIKPAPKGAK